MSNSRKIKFNWRLLTTLLAVIPVFLVVAFLLLPKRNCCDDADPELEALTTRAMAGQLDAINALYQRAKADGVQPMEEHWALEGALQGDKSLRQTYAQMFKTGIDADRKKRILKSISERTEMPGTSCLLATLNDASSADSVCR